MLHREAWPVATSSQTDSDLKRRFEDGVLNPEMSQFLRLHAREDDFATTVLKARQFVDASELIKPKNRLKLSRRRHLTMHTCIVHRNKGQTKTWLRQSLRP